MTPTPTDLASIYAAYPRHVARAHALKMIDRALRVIAARGEPDPVAWLLARVEKYAASPAGRKGQFTPHCGTWMNKGHYDDDEREWYAGEDGEGSEPSPVLKFIGERKAGGE